MHPTVFGYVTFRAHMSTVLRRQYHVWMRTETAYSHKVIYSLFSIDAGPIMIHHLLQHLIECH